MPKYTLNGKSFKSDDTVTNLLDYNWLRNTPLRFQNENG